VSHMLETGAFVEVWFLLRLGTGPSELVVSDRDSDSGHRDPGAGLGRPARTGCDRPEVVGLQGRPELAMSAA